MAGCQPRCGTKNECSRTGLQDAAQDAKQTTSPQGVEPALLAPHSAWVAGCRGWRGVRGGAWSNRASPGPPTNNTPSHHSAEREAGSRPTPQRTSVDRAWPSGCTPPFARAPQTAPTQQQPGPTAGRPPHAAAALTARASSPLTCGTLGSPSARANGFGGMTGPGPAIHNGRPQAGRRGGVPRRGTR